MHNPRRPLIRAFAPGGPTTGRLLRTGQAALRSPAAGQLSFAVCSLVIYLTFAHKGGRICMKPWALPVFF